MIIIKRVGVNSIKVDPTIGVNSIKVTPMVGVNRTYHKEYLGFIENVL